MSGKWQPYCLGLNVLRSTLREDTNNSFFTTLSLLWLLAKSQWRKQQLGKFIKISVSIIHIIQPCFPYFMCSVHEWQWWIHTQTVLIMSNFIFANPSLRYFVWSSFLLIPLNLYYKAHLGKQSNGWSLKCGSSITCRCCSNYIFSLDLIPGFNGLGRQLQDKTRNI